MNMPGARRSSADRLRRMGEIIAALVAEPNAPGGTDDAALLELHADLLPELAEKLRELRAIQAAQREAAARAESYLTRRSPLEQVIDEELAVLRDALPQYDFLDRVRYGGQGAVYRARQRTTRRLVAIKVLLDGPLASDAQRTRFEIEAQVTSRLRHKNIVTLFEYGVVRARAYQALEFIEGMPIDDFVLLNDLAPAQIVTLFLKVLEAVTAAHQFGIIHRDLNPANILVDQEGEPHLLDFGLAKDTWSAAEPGHSALTGQIVGTLPYLSPEQAGGLDGAVDVRSDVYSLGIVLFQLLSDGFPYPVKGPWSDVRACIVEQEPQALRAAVAASTPGRWRPGLVNRDLELILRKALAKPKAERYQSVQALADDLRRYLSGDAISARADRLYAVRKLVRKYRLAVSVAAVIMLTLSVATAVTTRALFSARAERDKAVTATGLSLKMFERSMAVDDELLQTAGGVASQTELLGKLEKMVPDLLALAPGTNLRPTILGKKGDLALQQGRTSEAIAAFREVVAWCEAHEKSTLLEVTAPLRLHAYRRLYEANDPSIRPDQYVQYAEFVLSQSHFDPDVSASVIELLYAAGEANFHLGQYENSLAYFERAAALLGDPDPRDIRLAQVAAGSRERIASLRKSLGQAADVLNERHELVQFCQAMCAARPASSLARSQLLRAYHSLGWEQFSLKQFEDAIASLNRAIETGGLLAQWDSSGAGWMIDLAYTQLDLCIVYSQKKMLSEADTVAASALEHALDVAERLRHSPSAHSLLSACYVQLSALARSQDRVFMAQEYIELAVWHRELSLRLNPTPGNWKLFADVRVAQASLFGALGDPKRLHDNYSEALRIRRLLCENDPQVTDHVLSMADSAQCYSYDLLSLKLVSDYPIARNVALEANQLLQRTAENNPAFAARGSVTTQRKNLAHNQDLAQRRMAQPPPP